MNMKRKFVLKSISLLFIFSIISTIILADSNSPPNPPIIEGPTSGETGVTYSYFFTLTDPDPEDLMFNLEVDFGNNIIAEDCGCDKSWTNGTVVEVPYQWSRSGDYEIRARVQGEYGDWSEWSEPYIVSMPYLKNIYHHRFINKLVFLFPLLNQYLGNFFTITK